MNLFFNWEALNLLWFVWIAITGIVSGVCIWIYVHPRSAPKMLVEATLYGKIATPHKYRFIRVLQVPKRYFMHFYAFGTIINIFHLFIVYQLYFSKVPVPSATLTMLDFLIPHRSVSISAMEAFLGMTLVMLQTIRRFYECLYVSVYAPETINAVHYMIGYLFYFSVTLTLLSEAPGFTRSDFEEVARNPPPLVLRWYHVIGLLLFVYGTYIHHKAHVMLANLRKDKDGNVVTARHLIPKGSWFHYVSCPHYFAEIVIYLALLTVLGFKHYGWWLIVAWTVCSQSLSAGLTHQWYKEKFKDYPKERKAIIPFLWAVEM